MFDAAIVIILGLHELLPYKTASLIDKCFVCSDYSMDGPLPPLSPTPLGLPIPWDTTILKLGQLIILLEA